MRRPRTGTGRILLPQGAGASRIHRLADHSVVLAGFQRVGCLQPVLHQGHGQVRNVDADPPPPQRLRRSYSRAAAAEGVEHYITLVGRRLYDALKQRLRLLCGVAQTFLMPRSQGKNVCPDILCRHAWMLLKVDLQPGDSIPCPIYFVGLQQPLYAGVVIHPMAPLGRCNQASLAKFAGRARTCSRQISGHELAPTRIFVPVIVFHILGIQRLENGVPCELTACFVVQEDCVMNAPLNLWHRCGLWFCAK